MKLNIELILVLGLFITGCQQEKPQIAFTSDRDGDQDIYVMNVDGSEQTLVTYNDVPDIGPRWSPDGEKLAFFSGYGILIITPKGEVLNSISYECCLVDEPSWAPDSERIAFHSTIDGNFESYSVRLDDGELTRLTFNPSFADSCPVWSPDGKHIAYGQGDGGFNVHIMDANGENITPTAGIVPGTRAVCPLGKWSPDSTHFLLTWDLINLNIQEPITPTKIVDCGFSPDWSPDGARIVFAGNGCSNNSEKSEIYIVNWEGSSLVQLTQNDFYDGQPIWSPDGSQIAFVSERNGNKEIYVMNANGSEQTNLTQNEADDYLPAWSP